MISIISYYIDLRYFFIIIVIALFSVLDIYTFIVRFILLFIVMT